MPPPTPIAVGDVIQVTVELRYQSQTYLNVLHYKSLQSFTPTPYDETIDDLLTAMETDAVTGLIEPYQALVPDNVEFVSLTGQRVYPTREFYVRAPVGQAGTNPQDALTGNLGATISKRSQTAGRGRTGQFHTPCAPINSIVNGRFEAAYLTLLENLAQSIRFVQLEAGAGTGFEPGMFNPTLGAGSNWSPLIDTVVQSTARVMRRRTLGVGI